MQENLLSTIKKAHFIGIGGIGISAIARMLLLEGKKVSGSDQAASMVTEDLAKHGAQIFSTHVAENVAADVDVVIHTIAILENNPELVEACKRGIPTLTYPQALGMVSATKYTVAISGTHGKTTTTAMLSQVAVDAEKDPTVVVGSFLKKEQSNFIAGKSNLFIAEACEYRRSFLNLSPKILIVTNIDTDHLDYYKDLADIQSAFRELAEKIPEGGFLVTDATHANIAPVVAGLSCTVVDYHTIDAAAIELGVPGRHNIENARAVLAVADILGIPRETALASLKNFSGTWRRFEYKGTTESDAVLYDDYGHHPSEIKATLQGARERFPHQRIVVAFHPHLFSRTKLLFTEFSQSFQDADEVILAPIYAAREKSDGSITSEMLAEAIQAEGKNAKAFANFDEIEEYLKTTTSAGDVIITMGAGDIYKMGEKLLVK